MYVKDKFHSGQHEHFLAKTKELGLVGGGGGGGGLVAANGKASENTNSRKLIAGGLSEFVVNKAVIK